MTVGTKKKARRRKTQSAVPNFENWESLNGAEFSMLKHKAFNHFYTSNNLTDLLPCVWNWMKQNEYKPKEIGFAKKGKDEIGIAAAVNAKLLEIGCPDFNETYADYWNSLPGTSEDLKPMSDHIKVKVEAAIEKGREVKEDKEDKKVTKNIQQHIFDQSVTYLSQVDDWLDMFIENPKEFDPDGFDVSAHFKKVGVTQAHARKIVGFYEFERAEFDMIINKQIKEGYENLSVREAKKYLKALDSVIDACQMIIDKGKAKRKPRKSKAKSKDKIVAKLKYEAENLEYNLASINPVTIIGASELWVFNTKTRKLGRYIAKDVSGLAIKGQKVVGYSEEKSVQKTLRKPEEALKEFRNSGKVALRKFLDDLTTKEQSLNGSINNQTVLLRVEK